jgi:hypothetical protein
MGANIIPLKGFGKISVSIHANESSAATLVIKSATGIRYINLVGGFAVATLDSGEESCLVVAHTPKLVVYDGYSIAGNVARSLDYKLKLVGVTA